MADIPKHLVLFPDGNSRWAKQQNQSNWDGYKKGYENLLNFCEWCKNRGVKVLTVFGFTTENWDRNKKIIDFLLKFFEKKLIENIEKYMKTNEWQKMGVHINVIGQREKLPGSLQKAIEKLEQATKNNDKLFLNLAVNYGGRWDILNAARQIVKLNISPERIDEKLFESYLSTAGLPNPDFIIRAGGQMRLSNFALWQSAYTELYFSPKMWPDFTEEDLDIALAEFDKRSRRFGK